MAVLLEVSDLPASPSAAASAFHTECLPRTKTLLDEGAQCLTLAFSAADHTHTAWRLAAVQSLAREHAPARINAIAGGSEAAIAAAQAFLESAEGLTGQYLPLDDAGAESVVLSAA
jgi:hypothetical protein